MLHSATSKGEKYKTTKTSKDLFKNITGFLKRDYFEMITASKAVTWTNQKASSTDQRHIAVIHHFPKGKKTTKMPSDSRQSLYH